MIALPDGPTPARPPPPVDHLSYSAISLYRQCPLRYFFRYVEQLPERVISSSLVFGSAIHAAIEVHFRELLVSGEPPDLPALLDAYRTAWGERGDAKIALTKDDDAESLYRLAERMLIAFQASQPSRSRGIILGIEEELREELVPDVPDLVARIDLLEQVDDQLVITDFKTARSPWSQSHVEDSGEQLLLYGQLVGRLLPHQRLVLQFVIVTKAKEPIVQTCPVANDPRRNIRTRRFVERVWSAISSGYFYPSPSPLNCPGCPFRSACRAW